MLEPCRSVSQKRGRITQPRSSRSWLRGGGSRSTPDLCSSSFSRSEDLSLHSLKPHGIVGTLLAFLLVFRTSMSYQRYVEGRNYFELATKHARDFMMLVRLRRPAAACSSLLLAVAASPVPDVVVSLRRRHPPLVSAGGTNRW